ncbi:hypothetical protein EV702DRAFT_640808 [Suillus placidus]|uniref:Uncharacterized protein n=1 Tax=Suillus placidus TaxID=48579 RepID=A0A9P6ZLS3_9AGAM|nr:hypothetical protein EV702DRAFT_640808 [Suillus placidus]
MPEPVCCTLAACILLFIAFASPRFSPHSHGHTKVTAMIKSIKAVFLFPPNDERQSLKLYRCSFVGFTFDANVYEDHSTFPHPFASNCSQDASTQHYRVDVSATNVCSSLTTQPPYTSLPSFKRFSNVEVKTVLFLDHMVIPTVQSIFFLYDRTSVHDLIHNQWFLPHNIVSRAAYAYRFGDLL